MSYFAQLDQDNKVVRVIVAEQEFIDSGVVGDPSRWIETDMDGTLRKNGAGKGSFYDPVEDHFYHPKPFESWTLDKTTARWKAPKEKPVEKAEETLEWDETQKEWIAYTK